MTVDYGQGPKQVSASLLALFVYESQFGGADMARDLFEYRGGGGGDLASEVNWTACVKALWAMLRAADRSVPPFEEWAASVEGVNLVDVAPQVLKAAREGFFRSGATGKKA